MISPAEREFAIKQLDQTRDALLGFLQGLSRDQLLYRADPGRWSIAENVEHLTLVEKRLVVGIGKVLQGPLDLSRCSTMSDTDVVRVVANVENALESPPNFQPESRWPAEVVAWEFEVVRQTSRDFASTVTGDLRHYFIPHPFYGDFDCYQWLLGASAHCHRHTAQSEAVKASPAFPHS